MERVVSPQGPCGSPRSPAPGNVAAFGDGVFEEVTKVRRGPNPVRVLRPRGQWDPVPRRWARLQPRRGPEK